MRACMVAYTFYENDNRVRRYAETLVRRGDHVDAIALRRPGQSEFEIIRGVHVYRVQKRVKNEGHPFTYLMRLLAFFFRSAYLQTKLHLRHRYDLIHVHSVPDFEVFSTLIPRLMGAKVILDIHDIVPELYASKFKISHSSLIFRLLVVMEWLSIRYSNHVIVANHLWHERLLTRSAKPKRTSTILNYPDPTIFTGRREFERSRESFTIFYPGTLSSHQGVDLIIRAVAKLREAAPNLRAIIVGDGPERKNLEALIQSNALEGRVTISSGVSIEEIANLMSQIDLGVEPKRKNTFGNEALSTKILEFMAMSVPVAASDTLIHQRYFGDDLVDFFCSDDLDDLCDVILRLMNDPARRMHLVTRGLHFIEENNWLVKRGQYLDLVDRIKPDHFKSRANNGTAVISLD